MRYKNLVQIMLIIFLLIPTAVFSAEWSSMTSGTGNSLSGVWGSSGTDVFAVGDAGTILHYDGSGWSAMTSGTGNSLSSVWGSPSMDVFAVGNNGTILRYSEQATCSTWTDVIEKYDTYVSGTVVQ